MHSLCAVLCNAALGPACAKKLLVLRSCLSWMPHREATWHRLPFSSLPAGFSLLFGPCQALLDPLWLCKHWITLLTLNPSCFPGLPNPTSDPWLPRSMVVFHSTLQHRDFRSCRDIVTSWSTVQPVPAAVFTGFRPSVPVSSGLLYLSADA